MKIPPAPLFQRGVLKSPFNKGGFRGIWTFTVKRARNMHSVDEKKVLVFQPAGHEPGVEVSQVREILAAPPLPEPLVWRFVNSMALNQARTCGLSVWKSPFEKGGFRGISRCYSKSPLPPFRKGGLKTVVL